MVMKPKNMFELYRGDLSLRAVAKKWNVGLPAHLRVTYQGWKNWESDKSVDAIKMIGVVLCKSPGDFGRKLAIEWLLAHENATIPLHRQGEAGEMVGGVLYLASDASSFTTGHDLVMDGGYTVW